MTGRWPRFVALGDSLTEGVGDAGADGRSRGWADRFAAELAWRQGGLSYANLAIRGQVTAEVVSTQLRPAIALAPDLASVVVGMNDLIRPRINLVRVCLLFEYLVARLARTGAVVVTATLPDPGAVAPLPGLVRRRFSARLRQFNDNVWTTAERYGARCLDLAERARHDPAGWSADRLHPSPYGHQRLAAEFLHLLTGVRSSVVMDRPVALATRYGVREQLHWVLRKAGPWFWDHVTSKPAVEPGVPKLPTYTWLESRRAA